MHRVKIPLQSVAELLVLLDADTLLERKHIGHVTRQPARVVATTIRLHEYRAVDGLRLPFAIVEERNAVVRTTAFNVDEIEVKVPLEDELVWIPRVPAPGE